MHGPRNDIDGFVVPCNDEIGDDYSKSVAWLGHRYRAGNALPSSRRLLGQVSGELMGDDPAGHDEGGEREGW